MSLSLIPFLNGFLALCKKTVISIDIKLLLLLFSFLVLVLLTNTMNFLVYNPVYVDIIYYSFLFYIKYAYTYLYVIIKCYSGFYLFTLFCASFYTLVYLLFLNKSFKNRHPYLYLILLTVCSIVCITCFCILIYKIITYITYMEGLLDNILRSGRGSGREGGCFPGSNPATGSQQSGPSGSGGGGGGGGEPSSSTPHTPGEERKSSDSGSTWSYDEYLIHDKDSAEVKDEKYADFVYDLLSEINGESMSREEFDKSDSNPLNWTSTNRILDKKVRGEVEARLVFEFYKRMYESDKDKLEGRSSSFTLKDLGINHKHLLSRPLAQILFPKEHFDSSIVRRGEIYSPNIGLELLKALRNGSKK